MNQPLLMRGEPRRQRKPATVLLWALAAGLLVNFLPIFLPFDLGVPFSFLGWMIPLLASVYVLANRPGAVRFPIGLWLPWMTWIVLYLVQATVDNALQRSIMLLTPLLVGMAFSTLRVDEALLETCDLWLRRFAWIFLVGVGIASGLLVAGALYDHWGSASGTITASLLATWFAARYAFTGQRRDLLIWALLALVPVAYITRMGILVIAATLPLTLAPWPALKRLMACAVLLFAGLAVFQLDRIQAKMFHSGQGTLEEAVQSAMGVFTGEDTGTSDFRDNARKGMNQYFFEGVKDAYWLGHGANATEPILISQFDLQHPHNDWLRLQYEYGTLGMGLFALAMVLQAIHAWFSAKRLRGRARIFMLAGSGAFIPMAMLMLTDNVILYVAWFGNLHFAMLGLGYAALRGMRRASGRPLLRAS
ncbi:MAG: hypothetical protein KDC54_21980 [Lewinella sp.]|nr:hypothetical protein [Lewinella sp.]